MCLEGTDPGFCFWIGLLTFILHDRLVGYDSWFPSKKWQHIKAFSVLDLERYCFMDHAFLITLARLPYWRHWSPDIYTDGVCADVNVRCLRLTALVALLYMPYLCALLFYFPKCPQAAQWSCNGTTEYLSQLIFFHPSHPGSVTFTLCEVKHGRTHQPQPLNLNSGCKLWF